jgi:ABC-type transport system involved in multi-copper enzyme maturation permease subunit
VLLSAAAVAVLLLLLPDICSRAVDETSALSLQVGISTIATFLSLLAGFAGLRAGAREGDLGAVPEWLASPLGHGAYAAGRLAGVVAACALLLVALSACLLPSQFASQSEEPLPVAAALVGVGGILLAAAQFAALGLLLGAVTTPQLAAVLLAVVLVATRTIVPDLAAEGGLAGFLGAALPDPSRLDLSREIAFRRPVGLPSAALGCLAATLNASACLAAATWALRRREG